MPFILFCFGKFSKIDHAIGYPYGSDLWSFHSQFETWLSKKILLSFDWLFLNKGNNNLSTYWEAKESSGLDFPSRPISKYNLIDLNTTYYHKLGLLKIGLSNKIFANKIAMGENENYNQDVMLYLEIQLIKGLGFNI